MCLLHLELRGAGLEIYVRIVVMRGFSLEDVHALHEIDARIGSNARDNVVHRGVHWDFEDFAIHV